jgi:hypothetical protein
MPEAKQIGVWFAIVGIALMVQGCWEDQHLALLGDGGCRTADDRHGDHTTLSQVAFDECQAQCFSDNGTCTAIEYTTEGGVCEIHSEPITKYAKSKGVACYIKSDLASRE